MSSTNLCKQTLGKAEAKYICRVNSDEYMVNHVENVKLKQKTKKHKSDASFKKCLLYRQTIQRPCLSFFFFAFNFYKLPPPRPLETVVLWACIQYMHFTLNSDLYRATIIELGMKV